MCVCERVHVMILDSMAKRCTSASVPYRETPGIPDA